MVRFLFYKGGFTITKSKDLHKLVTLSILSAIGILLMTFIEIKYPFAPFLKIEFSDVVIFIVFILFGFKSAFLVAVLKTLGDLLLQGVVGPYAIGQITALVASMSYVFLLKITKFNIIEDGPKKIVLKSLIIVSGISIIMTVANYLFLTPIFLGEHFWFQIEDGSMLGFDGSYLVGVIVTYIPFNIIKGTMNIIMFLLIAPRLLTIYKNQFNKETNDTISKF